MKEIKPCPFCGSTNIEVSTNLDNDRKWCTCKECDTEGPLVRDVYDYEKDCTIYPTEDQAITYWNKRV